MIHIIPTERISKHQLNIPPNLKLAAPELNIQKKIDSLIGAQFNQKNFQRQPNLGQQYKHFIQEYLELEHMQFADKTVTGEIFYLLLHTVIKQKNVTTILCIVFDGSSKTTTGYSLNDMLMLGPAI